MSYRVTVTARFEAAHNLLDYDAARASTRHSYRSRRCWRRRTQQYDLAVDFVPAKRALEAIAKELDYTYLNEHPASRPQNVGGEPGPALFRAPRRLGPWAGRGSRSDGLGRTGEPATYRSPSPRRLRANKGGLHEATGVGLRPLDVCRSVSVRGHLHGHHTVDSGAGPCARPSSTPTRTRPRHDRLQRLRCGCTGLGVCTIAPTSACPGSRAPFSSTGTRSPATR